MMKSLKTQLIKILKLKSQRRRSLQLVKNRILRLKRENKILIRSDLYQSEFQFLSKIMNQVQEVQQRRRRKDWKDFLGKSDRTQQEAMIPLMKSHLKEGIRSWVVVKERRKLLIIGLIWFSFGLYIHTCCLMIRSNCTLYQRLLTFL